MIEITESEVIFGPFSKDDVYKIENSLGHKSLGEGIKIIEFTYINNDNLFFIEAKSSIPRPESDEYEKFWSEILEKFENALLLQFMGCVGRNAMVRDELPSNHRKIKCEEIFIHLRLVIPKIPSKHLPPITDFFRKKAHRICKLLGIKLEHVAVFNECLAINAGLVKKT